MSRHSVRSCRGVVFVAVLQIATIAFGQERAASDPIVVHEWGTFTSLQDELGNAIGGINADDEPVPDFVHRLNWSLIVGPRSHLNLFAKSVPQSHPDVTMRLETPVVYFHPAPGTKLPLQLNIEVAFRGGWLSEYYPAAEIDAPGAKSFGPITADTLGRLTWKDLQVGTDAAGPETTAPVWLAPRAVDAANVTANGGESERYLFYRGVGHMDSPLRVSRDSDDSLVVTANFPLVEQSKEVELVVPAMWLVDIRENRSLAFRKLEGVRVPNDGKPSVVAKTSAKLEFDSEHLESDKLSELSASIREALIEDGLFADEADALLNTWKASYFETPGLRLFYLLPREWTDHVMPMKLSTDSRLVRTMIGRVEIVTPAQREQLKHIAAGPASKRDWMLQPPESCRALAAPADYEAYQSLGRFRNALVLDELKRRPTPALQTFINNYGLRGYLPATTAATSF